MASGSLRISVDFRQDAIVRLLDQYKREKPRIISRALNRAAVTVRAEGAREIAAQIGGKVAIGEVKRAIFIDRSTRAKLTAVVRAIGRRRISLAYFAPRQTKTGVRVTVGGRSVEIPHAFLVRSRGRRFVAIRAAGSKGRYYTEADIFHAATKRLPIAALYAPGVPDKFVNDKVLAAMRNSGEKRFREVIEQEWRFLMSKQ